MVNIGDMPRGIDVSKFQRNVNWPAVANSGITYAFARTIDDKTGTTPDPFFVKNFRGMKDAGLLRGAYHFFRPSRNAAAAANLFVSIVGRLEQGDLPPVLDVEDNSAGLSANRILDGIGQWIDIVEAALGRQVLIYTFTPFWRDVLGNSTRFSDHPLWIAHFTRPNVTQPTFPSAFKTFSFWQFTENGRCPGVTGNVDLDRFNGSMDGLRAFAGFPRPQLATEGVSERGIIEVGSRGLSAQPQAAAKSGAKKGAAKKSAAKSSKSKKATPKKSAKKSAKKQSAKKSAGPKNAARSSAKKSAAKKQASAKRTTVKRGRKASSKA